MNSLEPISKLSIPYYHCITINLILALPKTAESYETSRTI